jgi:hypothetical protein
LVPLVHERSYVNISHVTFIANLAGALVACTDRDEEIDRGRAENVMHAPSVTIVALARDPAHYEGQTVRLGGDVEARVGPRVFVIRGEGILWAATVVVFARGPDTFDTTPPGEGERVEVRGIVRQQLPPELAQELDRDRLARIGDGPYVVADSIRRAE